MSLDFSSASFRQTIDKSGRAIDKLYQELEIKRVYRNPNPAEIQQNFSDTIPEHGLEIDRLLEKVEKRVFGHATLNVGPHFYGYITGGGNQAAVLGEMLKAALNQNNLKWHSSPVSTELEKLVCRWIAQFIGYPEDCGGVLLDGGSLANFECLAIARTVQSKTEDNIPENGLYQRQPMTLYVSEEGHSSFDKAADILGMGKNHLRKVPADREFRVNIERMEQMILEDRERGYHPICAIGIAGTTNTGAVDDLKALAELCQRHNLWFHVDAAYGGPAAALPEYRRLFSGMEKADSLVVNPHKWMYVPFGAACVLVKDPDHMRKTFSLIPDYLASAPGNRGKTDLMEYNLPLTKDFKALKVWMTIKAYGTQKLKQMVRADIEKAAYLTRLVTGHKQLELLAPVPLSIVCFRYRPGDMPAAKLDRVNDRLIAEIERDGRVFLTGTKINGQTALRACLINHLTKRRHLDRLVDIILELGRKGVTR
ncbi:MAG: pyridoxal-dependent decarboxylase [Balneolaceae bacterium]|nr:pyridoxal-dependent decarboxylase [Balneolaceae bacterium]